ncbi:hypothetical protein B9G98_03448 [Wickerhamiella sorbophila]|uniref:Uncharacterized protein n=1 Tax=Wickerhamiella sorbophila TaxID=45607 RepID=A0A2T0FLF8_9ASCO|nr:hypothetical protein B9G98_03448 [Wickerhamiella sorbophila]PRT55828.1 hypothetical protein B9G98_03448 [Wickerhamiella sorbophila]
MADALGALSSTIEGIPGFGAVSTVFQAAAPDVIKTKDPFYEEIDGDKKRRKAPGNVSEVQRKLWKKVMKRAWYHDRNFCNCFPIDLGLGIIPIVTILPLIGPWICYTMHAELIKYAADAGCPKKTLAKMGGNVTFDFLISICPVLGSIFCWMNACSTKNAALFDTFMRNHAARQEDLVQHSTEVHDVFQQDHQRRMQQARSARDAGAAPQANGGQGQRPQPQQQGIPKNQVPKPQPAYTQTRRSNSPDRSNQPTRPNQPGNQPGSQTVNPYHPKNQAAQPRAPNGYQPPRQNPYQARDQSPQRLPNHNQPPQQPPYQTLDQSPQRLRNPNQRSQGPYQPRDQSPQPRAMNGYQPRDQSPQPRAMTGHHPRDQSPHSQTQTRAGPPPHAQNPPQAQNPYKPPYNPYQQNQSQKQNQNPGPYQQAYRPPRTLEEAQAQDLAMRTRQTARPPQPVATPQSQEEQDLEAALAISRLQYEQQQRATTGGQSLHMPDPRNYS